MRVLHGRIWWAPLLGFAFASAGCEERPTSPLDGRDFSRVEGLFLYRGDIRVPADSADYFHGGELLLPPHGTSSGGSFRIVTCERLCPTGPALSGHVERLSLVARDSLTYDIRFELVRPGMPFPLLRNSGLARWGEMVGSWARLDESTGDTIATGAFLGFLEDRL